MLHSLPHPSLEALMNLVGHRTLLRRQLMIELGHGFSPRRGDLTHQFAAHGGKLLDLLCLEA